MKKFIYVVLGFAPLVTFAQQTDLSGVSNLINSVGRIINQIIPIIFALAIIYFFYGLVQFLIKGPTDPKAHDAGKQHMIYGVIVIFVMLSLYGLVGWLQSTLGINPNSLTPTNATLPYVPPRQ